MWDCVGQLNTEHFAGHADWRVPKQKELETIVDYSAAAPAVSTAFRGGNCGAECTDLLSAACSCTQSDYYWSATADASFPNSAWEVSFVDGLVDYGTKYDSEYIRAVRDMP